MSYIPNAGPTYTPTLTNVTNITASTAYVSNYIRIGSLVMVSGMVDIQQSGPGAFELGVSIPIASNFTQTYHLAGSCESTSNGDSPIYIKADTTNDRASINGSDNDFTNHSHYFVFMYNIF